MVNAFRYGFVGVSDVRLDIAFALVGALIVVLMAWAYVLLRRGAGIKS
jgi:ABC-2 type transport system permease protein